MSRRGADLTAAPWFGSKHDSFEQDGIAVRQKAVGAVSPVGSTRSVSPQKIHPKRSASKSSGPMAAPDPKKIDIAVAWLRTVLTTGERAAAEVEAEARCVGIKGAAPSELFLHAKSSFTDDEWSGFTGGAPPETIVVGVQIADAKDSLKLFRPGRYPIMRGSALILADDQAFLWTAGYAPRLDTYLGPETPNPVLVRRQRGDCAFDTILRDVMGLTKINFNSCLHNDRLPVTIRFADAVGEIMLAAPQSGEPRLPFKFYI